MLPRSSVLRFLSNTVQRLGSEGVAFYKPTIPSKTLRRALHFTTSVPVGFSSGTWPRAELRIPHYWSVIAHEGRGPVRPVQARVLVWFANPKNDPRNRDGYPVRLEDRRRLTAAEYEQGLWMNRLRAMQGLPPYMIVTSVSGPARGVPWFSINAEGFVGLVRPILEAEFREFVLREWTTLRPRTAPVAVCRLR